MPAHDVERLPDGSFRLAETQYRTGLGLFTDYWLAGAAVALKRDLVQEIAIIGGEEERPDCVRVSRAHIARKLMILHHGSGEDQITAHKSKPHTEGNVEVALKIIEDRKLFPGDYVLLLTTWHIPRALRLFRAAGLIPPFLCTEELWRLDAVDEQELEERDHILEQLFRRPGYAQRLAREVRGLSHELIGTYFSGSH